MNNTLELNSSKPFILGVCGGSASGKTTIASLILKRIKHLGAAVLSMDSFYKVLDEKQHEAANRNEYNFDCPEAFDFQILRKTLKELKEGLQVEVPMYNFITHRRATVTETVKPANIIIFEGIMTFHDRHILEMLDMKVFVDADDDMRLARRIKRDTVHRSRDVKGLLKQYHESVRPSYKKHIEPLKRHADVMIPNGGENCEVIIQHIIKCACNHWKFKNSNM